MLCMTGTRLGAPNVGTAAEPLASSAPLVGRSRCNFDGRLAGQRQPVIGGDARGVGRQRLPTWFVPLIVGSPVGGVFTICYGTEDVTASVAALVSDSA